MGTASSWSEFGLFKRDVVPFRLSSVKSRTVPSSSLEEVWHHQTSYIVK